MKREIKKLLKNRIVKLGLIKMDIVFYTEAYAHVLKYDITSLREQAISIESEMKAIQNWGKEKRLKREKELNRDYSIVQGKIAEYMNINSELETLYRKEKDHVEYIAFVKEYLKNKRWKEN